VQAIITLNENAPAKIQVEKGGAQRNIFMNLQQLADYIVGSIKVEEMYEPKEEVKLVTASPSLPPNTIKYAKLSNETDLIFLFHPACQADVRYHNDVFLDVPFPNLVFCFGVQNQRLSHKYVFAYKDRFLRDNTELFRFPFSNVFNGGGMCYHDTEKFHDLVQLQSFPYNWLSQPFNDHLYNQDTCNKLNLSLREIFMKSQGKVFDYDMLVTSQRTFSEWANKLLDIGDE
jgi:hypothetical protein